jgi:hypothetical protein
MGFKANFSSSDNAFVTNFKNEAQGHSPNFGTYNTITIYDGENGATFYPNVSEDGFLSWTNDRELPNPTPRKVKGEDGKDGVNGVSVISVRQTIISNADGGTNVVTVTLSNGNNYTFSVINGSKGSKGDTGAKGDKGDKGDRGAQGIQGIQGIQGVKGDSGANGKDGYTPQKGTDYWTPSDKVEMVNDVISALPKYNGEVVSV